MEAQVRGEQQVFVLLCDAGRLVCPGKHLFSTKAADLQKNLDLIFKNRYDIAEESYYQLIRRKAEEDFKAGMFLDWIQTWFPKQSAGKWQYPNAIRAAYILEKFPFAVDDVPGFWNKCVMPSQFFALIDGVGNSTNETVHLVTEALKTFFVFALENKFASDDRLSPSQCEASKWFSQILEAFGALIAVAHPRYGIFNTSMDTVSKLFPFLDPHQAVSLGTVLGGVFSSLQSILANHEGWQDLLTGWQKYLQPGYQAAPVMNQAEALGWKILDLFDNGNAAMPITVADLDVYEDQDNQDSLSVPEPFLALATKFFEMLSTHMPTWSMHRKHAEKDHNDLGLQIIEKWHALAVDTYKVNAVGELQSVSQEVFGFMKQALEPLNGSNKDKLADLITKRLAMSTEQAQLGVLSRRVETVFESFPDVDAFFTAFKETINITKTGEFLKKLESSRTHLWKFMSRSATTPEVSEIQLRNAQAFNLALAKDHSFVHSLGSDVKKEQADAEKFNKQSSSVAVVMEKFRKYKEELRSKGQGDTSFGLALISLRDAVVTAKAPLSTTCQNVELQTICQNMTVVFQTMLANTGAVGQALAEDGVSFLVNFRKSLVESLEQCKLECGGTTDGTMWHPDDPAIWEDTDALTSHFNRTLGTTQGPAVESHIDAMIADHLLSCVYCRTLTLFVANIFELVSLTFIIRTRTSIATTVRSSRTTST